jgi:hypothetical protein
MEKSSQIAWKIVPLRRFFPLKVVPLIKVLLYNPLSDHPYDRRFTLSDCLTGRQSDEVHPIRDDTLQVTTTAEIQSLGGLYTD